MAVDMLGNKIEVGDRVAWSAVARRSAYIKIGRVTKLGETGGFSAMVEEKGALGWRRSDKPTRITYADRTLIIEKNTNDAT